MNPRVHDILRESAVAAHACRARPTWVFTSDGSRLVFANAVGAAMLGHATAEDAAGAANPAELGTQIARCAATLRAGGPPRLERLRGLGALGRTLTCSVMRIASADGPAILVASTEAAGPALTLAERARYLIGGGGAAAAFAADGALICATVDAATHLNQAQSLRDLRDGIETLPIGDGADAMVLALFPADSRPIRQASTDASTPPALLDLSPIAEAITAMTKVPPQQNGDSGEKAGNIPGSHGNTDANGGAGQTERRHPLRFVFETDAENRFTISGDDFMLLAGPRTANLLGRFWGEISAKLALDPEGLVAHALVSRDTWSGIEVTWPTADGGKVQVTLSGIPIFDRDQAFRGYRGLGVWTGDAADDDVIARTDAGPVERVASVSSRAAAADDHPIAADADPNTAATQPEPEAEDPVLARTDDPLREDALQFDAPQDAVPQDVAQDDAAEWPAPPENVVPFRSALAETKTAALNPAERSAFRDLGSRLSARLKGADELARGLMEKVDPADEPPYVPPVPPVPVAASHAQTLVLPDLAPEEDDDDLAAQRPVLEKLPLGLLVYRGSNFIYANPAFLAFAGHDSLTGFAESGGLDSMLVEFDGAADDDGQRLRVAAADGEPAMAGRLVTAQVAGDNAMVLMLQPAPIPAKPEATDHRTDAAELAALLDIAVDGVVTLDQHAMIVSANIRAETLFGYDVGALAGRPFGDLFAPESERAARSRLDRLMRGEVAADDDPREIIGRRRQGKLVSLQLMLGRANGDNTRYIALFRDITRWRDAEKDMTAARQQAEKASAAKSEFLAKISHEMRTPLNAIIGFSDVMMEERFGPVGNERYRDYLKDINTSGAHLVSLLNDLLDLSKIEAGKMELSFERVDLNEVTQQSVAIMQAQANRARVIVRTALSVNIPGIIADTRSVRQIVLNLLSNSIKFTGPGGQVIVSTTASDRGDVMLRVRDTGVGMSEKDIETALQPFRQLTTSPRTDINGTGLGLPLTKALVEANRARFSIKSAVNAGTLVEIVFPAGRVLAE
jgi:PAS domain S-box-containing protein